VRRLPSILQLFSGLSRIGKRDSLRTNAGTRQRRAVLTVEGKSLRADLHSREMSFDDFVEAADYAVIEDAAR